MIDGNMVVDVWSNELGSIYYVTDKITRTWTYLGEVKKVTVDELRDVVNTAAGRSFFEEDLLLIKDNKVRNFLGLTELSEYSLGKDEMIELLKSNNLEKIEEFLQYCTYSLLETFAILAIELPVDNLDVANLIQNYSKMDVIQLIQERKEEGIKSSIITTPKSTQRPKRVIQAK